MPKYLLEVKYTPEGLKGVQAKGGTARVEAATELIKSVGGSLESFYFAFGGTDVYAVADMPDDASAAAAALAVSASGGASTNTVVLLTPGQMDAASKKQVSYKPPRG